MQQQQIEAHNYDWLAKVLIIGDSGVGKTNVLLRYVDNKFIQSHMATIGIDFKIKTLSIGDKKVKLQIWDTAGQERYRTICHSYYKSTMGVILTYAVDDRSSFNHIDSWVKQIHNNTKESICMILIATNLVANKSDISERTVSLAEGLELADSYKMNYYETSAKDNLNIQETFQDLGQQIKNKLISQPQDKYFQFTKLSGSLNQKKKKNSCPC